MNASTYEVRRFSRDREEYVTVDGHDQYASAEEANEALSRLRRDEPGHVRFAVVEIES
jgi:hypothetical protein